MKRLQRGYTLLEVMLVIWAAGMTALGIWFLSLIARALLRYINSAC